MNFAKFLRTPFFIEQLCWMLLIFLGDLNELNEPSNLFKANDLAYIWPRWYGGQISADCQQRLLFTKRDTSWRFLLINFLEKEDGTQK